MEPPPAAAEATPRTRGGADFPPSRGKLAPHWMVGISLLVHRWGYPYLRVGGRSAHRGEDTIDRFSGREDALPHIGKRSDDFAGPPRGDLMSTALRTLYLVDDGGWTARRLQVVDDAEGRCARCGMPGADTATPGWFGEELVAAHTRCVVGLGPPLLTAA